MNLQKAYSMNRQAGLSMIELMISMVIGLILTAAVLQVFVGSRVTYSMQSGLAKLQENGRFGMTYLSRDVRQAGYQGCTDNTTMANTVRDTGTGNIIDFLDLSNSIDGLDNVDGTASYDGRSPLPNTDVINIKYAKADGSCTIASHNPTAASLQCEDNHNFAEGDVMVVSDCEHTAVFQQSNVNNNGTVSVVVHNTGQGTPGNCTKGLGDPVDCSSANGTPYTFPPGSEVMGLESFRFFIANNDFGESSLYRESLINNSAAWDTSSVELVEGVEDMQILYGVDLGTDGTVDYYVPADEAAGNMDSVVAVRVSLLIRSSEAEIVQGDQNYQYNGTTVTGSDGRLRKVFTSTIALRNRL